MIHHFRHALAPLSMVCIILVMLVHLLTLARHPPTFIDEPWYANAAWNWMQTGTNFASMDHGTPYQVGSGWWPYLGNLPWVASFAAFGLGLFQARLVSWLFGLLLIVLTAWVGRRSFGMLSGALAALLLALSAPFTQASHYIRPDIMLAVAVMAAFGVAHKALTEDRWWPHLLAGGLLGFGLDIHQNAALFGLGLIAMYAARYGRRIFRQRGTWLCAAGGLAGIIYYLAAHILPNPTAYSALMGFVATTTDRPPIFTLDPVLWIKALVHEIGRYHFFENTLDFVLIGASFAFLAVRRERSDRLLLAFLAASFAGFVLIAGNKNDIYAVLFYPFFLLMVAETLVSLLRAGSGLEPRRVFVGALVLLVLAGSGIRFARPLVQNRDYDYYAVTDRIRAVAPAGSRIMGTPFWWLGLADYDYRSSLSLTYYHHFAGYTLDEGLQALKPDIVIIDPLLRGMRVNQEEFPQEHGFQIYNLPNAAFERFLAERGTKVKEFSDPWHGRFEIYAIRWD